MPNIYSRRFLLRQTAKSLAGLSTAQIFDLIKPSLSVAQSQDNLSMEATVADLKNRVPQWMRQYKIPGLSLAVIHQKRIFWHGSFGVKQYGKQTSS